MNLPIKILTAIVKAGEGAMAATRLPEERKQALSC